MEYAPVVLCGPSGAGKSTLIKMLINKHPEKFYMAISHTTRPMRVNEVNGRDYFFISESEFLNKIDKNEFIEYVSFAGIFFFSRC